MGNNLRKKQSFKTYDRMSENCKYLQAKGTIKCGEDSEFSALNLTV